MSDEVLYVEELQKSRGEFNLLVPSLTLRRSTIQALLGPNGAGKSTLCSVLAGTSQPTSGEIVFVESGSKRTHHRLGYAPQDTGLNLTMTGVENLRFFARLAGFGRSEARRLCDEIVVELGLGEIVNRRCRDLSVGQRRQIHVASGMLGPPEVLILDEPTAFMDVHARNRLYRYLDRLAREQELAVLYLTHEIREVERLATDCIIMDNGRFVFESSLRALSDGATDWVLIGPDDMADLFGDVQKRRHDDQVVVRCAEQESLALLRSYSCPADVRVLPPGLEAEYVWMVSHES